MVRNTAVTAGYEGRYDDPVIVCPVLFDSRLIALLGRCEGGVTSREVAVMQRFHAVIEMLWSVLLARQPKMADAQPRWLAQARSAQTPLEVVDPNLRYVLEDLLARMDDEEQPSVPTSGIGA